MSAPIQLPVLAYNLQKSRLLSRWRIRDASGQCIAQIHAQESIKGGAEGEYAIARQIETALNSHADLVRELESALFYIETYGGATTASFSAGGNMERVKAVLAKTKA